MKIKDCVKGYVRGVSKVIPPGRTFKGVLRKVRNMDPPILKGYFEVSHPSRIPQYRFVGTDYYRQMLKTFLAVRPVPGTNGKGHSKEQALASGLMELVERYSCSKYIIERKNVAKVCSFKELKSNPFVIDDLYANCIDEDLVNVLKKTRLETARLRWYEGRFVKGGKVYLPANAILFLEGTNGMAAGNSLEEALLHAVCEVIERHCLALIEIGRLKTPLIDPATVDSSIARDLINRFRSLKQQVFIKDFSLGVGLPVVGVVRRIDKSRCIITAGVATARDEALIRALTENSQAEDRQGYTEIASARHYFAHGKSVSLKDIPDIDDKNMRLELESVEDILNKQGMKIFYIDTTDDVLKIPSVIAYVSRTKAIISAKKLTSRDVLTLFIKECLETENYGDLARYLKRAVKNKFVDRLDLAYLSGIILKRRAEYRKAIRCLSRVAKVEVREAADAQKTDRRVRSFVNLGLCYLALDDKASAVDCYVKAIGLDPGFSMEYLRFSYDNIPSLARDKVLFEKARKLYRQVSLIEKVVAQSC
jgi:ribosomal protein S12 methylthiotransferase accessory factor